MPSERYTSTWQYYTEPVSLRKRAKNYQAPTIIETVKFVLFSDVGISLLFVANILLLSLLSLTLSQLIGFMPSMCVFLLGMTFHFIYRPIFDD